MTELPRPTPTTRRSDEASEPAGALRRDVLESLARDILDVGRFGRSLAVVALDVDGCDDLSVLAEVARRLSDSIGSGSVHRLGASEFVLVLSGASADDAEALLGTLHVPSETDEAAGVTLSAGITELVDRDGAQTALARAEHALWQAKQAGRGTVVVAVPGRRIPRFE